ncbi:YdcF family protein [Bacillus cereus]|uniref:YdcF family protein n=1 Tax=Bacillus cereus TaxID=1396 RepID=UPI0007B99932|nr:YdcF family protein [Bacillus cereus]MDA2477280.1 YdcF family protein [Bacillus cereus]MDA2494849.1 YdcF family protein [Bacillus cereus]MRC28618.1 YdcF family protein [Bacillus thuringiensis]HDR8037919.1 YdcF family protein [Bacillus cereus]
MMYFGIIPLILFIIFLISYLKDPRKIINGFLFNAFICFFLLFCVIVSLNSDSDVLRYIIFLPFLALLIMLPFGIVALMFGLFLNARILMKREGRRFTNCLTLLAALGMLFFMLLPIINPASLVSSHLEPIFAAISLISFYFFIHLSNFLSAYFLYQFNRPRRNQDFIIVLGSGLINDKVPPLLASRINKAIDFYWKQAAVNTPPTIIFSGGQGPDEGLPEAEAMQNYAVEKGIPLEHTVQENRSVNTYQNMLFSKEIMDSLKPEGKYKSIFTTNNFHLFRAGIYARQAGLNSQGIGSKTAFYYWPNAMIREYVAIVVMGRKRHMKICGTILGFALFISVLSFIFS